MKRIRVGNDIIVRATVTRLGVAEDFTGKRLALTLRSQYETVSLPMSVSGNVLTAAWLGSQQRKTGVYTLTLTEDYGDGSRNTVDECGCFALVSRSCQESGLTGGQTVECRMDISRGSGETTDVDLEITAPANGLSAYEIAARNGYDGTEQEWLASLRAESRVAMVVPFAGYVANAALQPERCSPDFVSLDTDRGTFVGAKRDEKGAVMYYSDFDQYGSFSADDYGAQSDNGRLPVEQRMYVDVESDTLGYWNGSEMRYVNRALTDEEIIELWESA